jgi:transcription elongation factor Elf1
VKPETESRSGPKPQCVNCGATSTPLWRRDSKFNLQCNACGLYEKLHKGEYKKVGVKGRLVDSCSYTAPRPKEFKHRRTDKRVREISPSGSDAQSAAKSPLRRSSAASSTKDEWVGIHSGSTCANCGTSTTPLWRKDSDGRIICNACGLYYKLHDSHRPVAMRVDAIKRRSRHDDRGRKLAKAANTPTDSATFDFASVSGSETGGPLQQTHSHLLNDGTLTSASPLSAIHIPSDLWDNQLCPMGAWGENCCQNLPQPDENHAHQYTTLPSAGNQTLQTADQTTMDSILGTDWLIPYSDQSPVTSTVTTGVPTASTPVSAMQFDPTSIQGNGASETIVGPSFSLKKRKFNATTSNVSNVTTSPTSWWPFDAQIQSQSQSNSPSKASEEK